MFDLTQLRCFIAVAEELHFGRAARRLNMTQPPLSRQIQILERVLGVQLLNRTSRSVELTPAGTGFLLEARRIQRLIESSTTMVRRMASGDEGTLSLGFTAASGYGYLPRLVKQLRATMPDVELALHEMVSGDQIEALSAGELDVGLVRPPYDTQKFDGRRVLIEPLVLAAPADHPLAARSHCTIADLAEVPMVMYSTKGARYFHDLINARFLMAGISTQNVQHVTQIHSMLALVAAGLGVGLVPAGARALHLEGVTYVPFSDDREIEIELYLIWRRSNGNPALHRLVDSLAS